MEKSMVIILLLICHIAITTVVAQHSMPFPSKGGDSCNVVQVNCGSAAPVNDESASQHLKQPGPPGKRGPKGDLGPIGRAGPQGIKGAKGIIGGVGPAGDKGSQGSKGQQGIKGVKGDTTDYMRIQNMMSATSCKDLNETYGVSTSGYYSLRTIGTGVLVSVYCDFRIYDGATSCKDLNETHGVSTSGYYQIETIDTGVLINVYCDFRTYEGVSNCAELVSHYGISTYGYYRLRINWGHPEYHRCPDVFTCKQMKKRDRITPSGKYLLGPANSQYEVHCNFSGSDAITEIRHDSMKEVMMPHCESRGCYSKIPRYAISLNDMIKIIENSRECRQYIGVIPLTFEKRVLYRKISCSNIS
uniref:uncharacterized protein LOC120345828 n=1 Tax=Styela clava TaxID=7725 RepID=UPI0019398168|nr:uncharacterized protein LOC120345828 [Styela clava]